MALRTIVAHSGLLRNFRRAIDYSIILKKSHEIAQQSDALSRASVQIVTNWWRKSLIQRVGRKFSRGLEQILASAGIITGSRHLVNWARQSFLYRWLTKEPEPEVIVIDLRDTYSVGPIISWLDRAIATWIPLTQSATVTDFFRESQKYIHRRPVRAVSILLLGGVTTDILLGVVTFSLTRQGLLMRFGLIILGLWGSRSTLTLPEILQSKPAQLAIRVLEPPEPVEQEPEHAETGRNERE